MRIALLGYGKMGRLIEQLAPARGHTIVTSFSRCLGTLADRPHSLAEADVAIDFSHPDAVLNNLKICLAMKKPLVIGTTGWNEQMETAKKAVEKENGSCLYAPNFSTGLYLFRQIVSYAAALINPIDEYDVSGVEWHHRNKLDSPSGTAKALTETLLEQMPRVKSFEFVSVRCGHIPGTHTLTFDSAADTLTLAHEARNRNGFALGAIQGAEWLLQKQGFFTMDDMMRTA